MRARGSSPAGFEVESVSAPRDSLEPRRGRPGGVQGAERQGGVVSAAAAPPIVAGMEQGRLGRLITSTSAGSTPAPATARRNRPAVSRSEAGMVGGLVTAARYGRPYMRALGRLGARMGGGRRPLRRMGDVRGDPRARKVLRDLETEFAEVGMA